MTMPARQVGLFQLGCWVAIAVAALHAAVHVAVGTDLSPHAQAGMSMLSPAYVIQVPGLRQPTYLGVVSALSLSYALLFATIGAAGLAVVRHGQHQPKLLRAVAGAFATGTALALVVSVVLSFSLQTFVLAVVPMCFGLAAVPEE
jgi:hypothetical protein